MLRRFGTRLFVFLGLLVLATPRLFAAELAFDPDTQKGKESYSIGYEVGLSMKSDGVEVDFQKLVHGLQDAIDGKEPLHSSEVMKKLVVDLKKRTREIQMRNLQEQIVKNAEESEKFMKENMRKDGIKSTSSGLQYRILEEGDGISPQLEDSVQVNYRGAFTDGKEFDNSYVRDQPTKVQVDGVIKGWAEALPMMKVGSKWQLFVPPSLAYGRRGLPGRIPPNKVLLFDLELLGVEKADKAARQPGVRIAQAPTARKMNLTGEIAKMQHGYIIRSKKGNVPSEIYTILNPSPKVLDEYVKSEKTVKIEARIVSGDNLEIEKIDGKDYP